MDQHLKNNLKAEFPKTWWIYYKGYDNTLLKGTSAMGTLSGIAGIYFIMGGHRRIMLGCLLLSGLSWGAFEVVRRTSKIAAEIFDES